MHVNASSFVFTVTQVRSGKMQFGDKRENILTVVT